MIPKSTSNLKSIDNFTASKQLQLFKDLKEQRFSGEVVVSDRLATKWNFHLYLGRIVYTTGGEHSVRRWRRNLAHYFPQLVASLKSELKLLQTIDTAKIAISWDYHLLCLWVEQQKVEREQAIAAIRAATTEVLFDIAHTRNIDYYLNTVEKANFKPLAMIDGEQQIIEAWRMWQLWQETKFADYSPNLAPSIEQSAILRKKPDSSKATSQILAKLFKGKYTFRDLAVQKQTSLLLVARSLTPYFRLGCMSIISIPDLSNPLYTSATESSFLAVDEMPTGASDANFGSTPRQPGSGHNSELKIACVDSNSLVRQIVKKVITSAGFQYVSDSGSLNTSAVLQEIQPNLVFINIELTEFSGYELCSLLRQMDIFEKNTDNFIYQKTGFGRSPQGKNSRLFGTN